MSTCPGERHGIAASESVDGALDCIGVDFRLDLHFSDGTSAQLEAPFTITSRAGVTDVVDPERKESLLPVLRLFGAALVRRSVDGETLTLVFAGGDTLVAGPDAGNESWHLCGPTGQNGAEG